MTAISDVKEMPGDAHGVKRPKLDLPIDMKTILVFCAILAGGLFFAAYPYLIPPGQRAKPMGQH